ncbi:MAG: hypothetical protein ACLPV8_25420 [Steroidobacteraceae bacterium]
MLEVIPNLVEAMEERGESVPAGLRKLARRADSILDGTLDPKSLIDVPAHHANYAIPLRNAAMTMYALYLLQDNSPMKTAALKAAEVAMGIKKGQDSPHLRGLTRTVLAGIKREIEMAGSMEVARRGAVAMMTNQVIAKGVTPERWVRQRYRAAQKSKPHDTSMRARQRALRKLLP